MLKEFIIRGFDMFSVFQDPNTLGGKSMRIIGNGFMQVENKSIVGKEELFEQLAEIEHQRWADWQKYLHGKCEKLGFGTNALVIPEELVAHWERQINTPYAELSEEEKERDRDQVRRYWGLIN